MIHLIIENLFSIKNESSLQKPKNVHLKVKVIKSSCQMRSAFVVFGLLHINSAFP